MIGQTNRQTPRGYNFIYIDYQISPPLIPTLISCILSGITATILRSRKSSIFHFMFKSQEWRKQNCLFCLSIPLQKKRSAVFENVKYFILNDFNFSIIPLHPKNVSPSLGIKYNYPPPPGAISCVCVTNSFIS